MISKRRAVMFLATGGYVGRIPIIPGTFGTLVGIPVAFIFSTMPWTLALPANIVLIFVAVWAARGAERELGVKDPGSIVIDEICGYCVTMLGIHFSLASCIAGFFLFRMLDIIKPPPARQIDRRLKGGWGVVMDDVVAGIMANLIMRVGVLIFSQ
jgi:phosphatidylglycerophosphatase A